MKPLRRQRADGYIDLWRPGHPIARRDGYVFEHRLVVYEAGLLTDSLAQVHHRNHDRQDNRLENLEVHAASTHATLHADEGVIANQYGVWPTGSGFRRRHREWLESLGDRRCEVCGKDINGLRLDATVCGNNCRIKRWKRAHRKPR